MHVSAIILCHFNQPPLSLLKDFPNPPLRLVIDVSD
jgi:hypothetical protein